MFINKNNYIAVIALLFFTVFLFIFNSTIVYSSDLYSNHKLIDSGIYPLKPAPIVTGYLYTPILYLRYIPNKKHIKHDREIKKLSLVIHKLNSRIPLESRYKIAKYIVKYTKGLTWPDAVTVASVIYTESTFYSNSVSYGNCIGLMQLSSQWRNVFPRSAFNSIRYNIKYGIKVLRDNYRRYNRDPTAALLVYNSGPVAYQRGYAPLSYYYKVSMMEKRINYLME